MAHRAYHGLPKTIRRADGKGGGAIVGCANYLIRLYEIEQLNLLVARKAFSPDVAPRHNALSIRHARPLVSKRHRSKSNDDPRMPEGIPR